MHTHIIPISYRCRVDKSLNRAGIRHEADYANNTCASAKVCPIHEFMHGCMNILCTGTMDSIIIHSLENWST